MPRLRSLPLLYLLLAVNHFSPLQAQTAAKRKPDIVEQVIKLLQAKLPESVILKRIQTTNTPVSPTTDQLIALKQAGATDAELAALEDPRSAAPAASAAATPAPPPDTAAVPVSPPATVSTTTTTINSTTVTRPEVKKRVAVDEFDYSTVKTAVAAVFGTNQDIGKGIQSMFVTRISKEGKVIIVERKKLQNVMAEQDLGASGRVKQGTNAKIGQIHGADAILYGDIVVFGRDDRHKNVSAGAFGGGLLGAGIAGMANSKKSDKAVVVIDYRLVDAETSEVIATGEARGESVRKSSSFAAFAAGAGLGGGGGGGAAFDMGSSNFQETIIGEATMDCVNKLAAALDEQLPKLETKKIDISARVAYVNGSTLTINAGSAQGVSVGDQLDVAHILNEVKDPTSGEVIDLATQKIGTMNIVQVKDRVAVGVYTGSGTPKAGDVAEKH